MPEKYGAPETIRTSDLCLRRVNLRHTPAFVNIRPLALLFYNILIQ